jgi:hypothetical protein
VFFVVLCKNEAENIQNFLRRKMKIIRILSFVVLTFLVTHNVNAVKFEVRPSPGPLLTHPTFQAYGSNALSLIVSNQGFPMSERTSPTNVVLLGGINAEYLTVSTTTPLYRGRFSPASPWESYMGDTVWWWIEAYEEDNKTLSLSDISITISSSDTENVLGKTLSFNGTTQNAYSPLAIGVREDGSIITGGPSNQQAKRVIVAVGSRYFPVSSASEYLAVQNYLASFPNWSSTAVVTAKGETRTFVLAKTQPSLIAILNQGRFAVVAANTGDPTTYALQSTADLQGTNTLWTSIGTIRAGQTNEIVEVRGRSRLFVRYAPRLSAQRLFPAPPTIDPQQ